MAIRRDFEQDIRKPERMPIYVLTSPDTLLLTEAIAKLRALCLTAAPDFNRNDFRSGECKPIDVISAAESMPMMVAAATNPRQSHPTSNSQVAGLYTCPELSSANRAGRAGPVGPRNGSSSARTAQTRPC